uniref:Cyclin I homolog (Predicted) n=1 Tax=Plecturocebus moloch TaxID=9523 RepID=B1MTN7_PLEMO|nr:cyclin I homolog (predicted) [Plecturocebus moloch]
MASGGLLSPQPPSSEVSAVQSPSRRPGAGLEEAALGFPLPPSPGEAPLPPSAQSRCPGTHQPGAASLSAPSSTGPLGPRRWTAPAGRTADRVPADAPAQASRPDAQSLKPRNLEGILDECRLLRYLQLAQDREARLWQGSKPQDEICIAFEEVVQWLLRLQNNLYFSRSTFNLALTIFSRLLISVKVKEKYLHCATIASLRLAAKLNEENEVIPQINDFIKHYGSDYSPNELLRMELAILDTLHWDLYIGTPLDFLTVFHALVVLSWPHVLELLPQRNPSLHVASLTRQLQHCMAGHQLLQFKGSTLALVIITLELERLMPDWCAPISDLLKKAQVGNMQYSCCKELVVQQLRSFQSSTCTDSFVPLANQPFCLHPRTFRA